MPIPSSLRRAAALLILALPPAACADGGGGAGHGEAEAAERRRRPALPPYEVRHVTDGGRISGIVDLSGVSLADSAVAVTVDPEVCGATASAGTAPAGASGIVVWLDGLRAGKPLPAARRYQMTVDRCRVAPAVLAVAAGGTLNVLSRDPLLHQLRFLDGGESEPVALVHVHDAGQVVPIDAALRQPGRFAVQCERHPWMHAAVEVFDHPYFATTTSGDAFSLDSVPPGRYRIAAWHPRLGTVTDSVTVAAGGTVTARLTFAPPGSREVSSPSSPSASSAAGSP